jgi:hypothetical protein
MYTLVTTPCQQNKKRMQTAREAGTSSGSAVQTSEAPLAVRLFCVVTTQEEQIAAGNADPNPQQGIVVCYSNCNGTTNSSSSTSISMNHEVSSISSTRSSRTSSGTERSTASAVERRRREEKKAGGKSKKQRRTNINHHRHEANINGNHHNGNDVMAQLGNSLTRFIRGRPLPRNHQKNRSNSNSHISKNRQRLPSSYSSSPPTTVLYDVGAQRQQVQESGHPGGGSALGLQIECYGVGVVDLSPIVDELEAQKTHKTYSRRKSTSNDSVSCSSSVSTCSSTATSSNSSNTTSTSSSLRSTLRRVGSSSSLFDGTSGCPVVSLKPKKRHYEIVIVACGCFWNPQVRFKKVRRHTQSRPTCHSRVHGQQTDCWHSSVAVGCMDVCLLLALNDAVAIKDE